jgi:tetratricopeptide (TPR) repeat protein
MLTLALSENQRLNLSNRWYIRGNAFLAQHREVLAETCYHKILSLKETGVLVPTNILADVLHNLGLIAEERQDAELAITYYSRALQEDENHRMTWLFLAKLYFERYEKKRCLTDYRSGMSALYYAETALHNFPAVRYLKRKYAIA